MLGAMIGGSALVVSWGLAAVGLAGTLAGLGILAGVVISGVAAVGAGQIGLTGQ